MARHFQLDQVLENIEQDRELLGEMVEIFLQTLPEQLSQLREACQDKALDRVAGAAHSLKGSLLTLSADQGSKLAAHLEQAGRARDGATVAATLRELESELEALCLELRSLSLS